MDRKWTLLFGLPAEYEAKAQTILADPGMKHREVIVIPIMQGTIMSIFHNNALKVLMADDKPHHNKKCVNCKLKVHIARHCWSKKIKGENPHYTTGTQSVMQTRIRNTSDMLKITNQTVWCSQFLWTFSGSQGSTTSPPPELDDWFHLERRMTSNKSKPFEFHSYHSTIEVRINREVIIAEGYGTVKLCTNVESNSHCIFLKNNLYVLNILYRVIYCYQARGSEIRRSFDDVM